LIVVYHTITTIQAWICDAWIYLNTDKFKKGFLSEIKYSDGWFTNAAISSKIVCSTLTDVTDRC